MKKTVSLVLKALVFITLFAAGIAIGILVMSSLAVDRIEQLPVYLAFVFVGFILVYNLCVIVHEGGHLLFGLACGYRFSSFRIGSLMLVRQNGKMTLRTLKLQGTGGQCLLIPPENDTVASMVLYNLGGVIMNLIFSIVCLVLYLLLPYVQILTQIILLAMTLSAVFVVLNGVPLDMAVPNDGANTVAVLRSRAAARCLKHQLLISAENTKGVSLRDMPAEWFLPVNGADMQNQLCASISVFACNRLLDMCMISEANEAMKQLLSDKVNIAKLHRSLLVSDRIFCTLFLDGRDARIADLYTSEQKKFMKSMANFPSIIRTEYAIALIRDKDEKTAEKIKQRFEKRAKSYPYPQDIVSEKRLMEMLLSKYNSEMK